MVKFPRDICPAVGSISEDLWLTPIRGTSCTESGPPDGRKRHKGCTLNFSHISIPTFRVPNTLLGSRLILRRCLQLYGAHSSQKRICMASHSPDGFILVLVKSAAKQRASGCMIPRCLCLFVYGVRYSLGRIPEILFFPRNPRLTNECRLGDDARSSCYRI